MSENRNEPKEKKKNHTGRNVAVGVIVALMLSTGGYFGLGPGQGMLGLTPNDGGHGTGIDSTSSVQEDSGTSSVEEAVIGGESSENGKEASGEEEGKFIITVSESKILCDGRELSVTELENLLESKFISGDDAAENLANLEIVVRDDHAVKSSFDAVTALLTKLDIPYTTEE